MATIIRQSELDRMAEIVIDEETGMTELDYWEWSNCFNDNIIIIDDREEK